MKYSSDEEMLRTIDKMKNLVYGGIDFAQRMFGNDSNLTVIKEVVWDREMDCFLEEIEELNSREGFEIAISNSGTNFSDIVIALTGHGWKNDRIVDLEYGVKAVVFKR